MYPDVSELDRIDVVLQTDDAPAAYLGWNFEVVVKDMSIQSNADARGGPFPVCVRFIAW